MRRTGSSGGTLLDAATGQVRRYGLTLLGLSGVINLLGITLSLYIMQVFDRVLSSRSVDTLLFLSLAAVIALSAASALDGIRSFALGRLAEWVSRRLGPDILMRSVERRLTEGNLRSEMLRELSQLRGFLAGPGVPSLLDLPWMPIYLLIAFLIHPMLGIVALVGAAILFALAVANERLNNKDIRSAAALAARAMQDSDAIMRNAEVIDSLGMAPQMARRWSRGQLRELDLQDGIQQRTALLMSGTRLTRALIQVVLYAVAAMLVLDQQMTGGAMMAGSIIVSRLLAPVEAVLLHWKSLLMTREIYRRLQTFFALPPLRSTTTELPAPRGHLVIERVTMMMPGHPTPVLRNVDLSLLPGEHLAIVGPAASGKTTLSRVMLGVLRPQSGVARLDGVDVSKWQREEFGRHVGYLPQDVELFSGTIAQNIARFTDAEDEAIIRAAQMAGCHQLILQLPNAYDTEIGEAGMLLSGGQRQQVGLARALFGSPRFVVLDEPNSNLDARGDNALKIALERLKTARVTTIVVTHRQSILAQMDKLLVMHAGAVKMFGPTEKVLRGMRGEPEPIEKQPVLQGSVDRSPAVPALAEVSTEADQDVAA